MFRIYNDTQKRWECGYELWGGFEIDWIPDEEFVKKMDDVKKGDTLIVEQYIGKEDKEKTPVYEGDYIRFNNGTITYQVYWDEKTSEYMYCANVPWKTTSFPVKLLEMPNFTVVGNVHETLDNAYYDIVKKKREHHNPEFRLQDS